MPFDNLFTLINTKKSQVLFKRGVYDTTLKAISDTKNEIQKINDQIDQLHKAQILLNQVSSLLWVNTKQHLESIVSQALKAIFYDRDYKFVINNIIDRGTSAVSFSIIEDDIITDIWDEGGLGIADVVGFSLRIAYLVLYRPEQARILVWDEPFRFVHKRYKDNLSRFIKKITEEFKMQIVLVTHDNELISCSEQIFKVEKIGKYSIVQEQVIV